MSSSALRSVIHLSTGSLLLAGLWSWEALRLLAHAAVVAALTIEIVRLRSPEFQRRLSTWLPVFRAGEQRSLSGAFWLSAGYALASWLPSPWGGAGVAVGALADPAGALVGRGLGFRGGKSWPGTVAVWVVAWVLLGVFGASWLAATGGALAAAAAERWCGPVDDNLLVAPSSALVCWLLA